MSADVQQVLKAFDALQEPDKHEATVEILRRYPLQGDVREESLIEIADELFRTMDKDESANGPS
jgi:hypothetical protein